MKLIDTSDNLSIQVHPPDDYAKKYENSSGKNECWLILKAQNNSGIYLDIKSGFKKTDFLSSIEKNHNLSEHLNYFPVKEGDFFNVPAGTIHAIGPGILLLEVQQSSGITYRVWDWNRRDQYGKSRELHLNKALDVINFDKKIKEEKKFTNLLGSTNRFHLNLLNNEHFSLELITLKNEEHYTFNDIKDEFVVPLDEGLEIINLEKTLKLYESFFIIKKDFNGEKTKVRSKNSSGCKFLRVVEN